MRGTLVDATACKGQALGPLPFQPVHVRIDQHDVEHADGCQETPDEDQQSCATRALLHGIFGVVGAVDMTVADLRGHGTDRKR